MGKSVAMLLGAILFLGGTVCGIVVLGKNHRPILNTNTSASSVLPTSIPLQYVPSEAITIPGVVSNGSLRFQAVDSMLPATISGDFVLRQSDGFVTDDKAIATLSGTGVIATVFPSTTLTASSLLPTAFLFTLPEGKLSLNASIPFAIRSGITLIQMEHASTVIRRNALEKEISITVSQGSASAAFINEENETQVLSIQNGQTIRINEATSQIQKTQSNGH